MTTHSYKTRLKKEYERVLKNGIQIKTRYYGENVEKVSEDAFIEFLDIAIKAINKQIEELDKNIENEEKLSNILKVAKSKISLKLWSTDYAKGYCYAILNNINVSNDDYNYYSKQIDEL